MPGLSMLEHMRQGLASKFILDGHAYANAHAHAYAAKPQGLIVHQST